MPIIINSLGILSSGVKFALHLVHFMTNFELQLQKVTKFFSYFWLQLVRMKSSKKWCPQFLITFLLFEILTNITFLFPLKSLLTIEIFHNIRTAHVLRNRGHGFAQRLFPQMSTVLKQLHQRSFELKLQHCTLKENPLRRPIPFHWRCIFKGTLMQIWKSPYMF